MTEKNRKIFIGVCALAAIIAVAAVFFGGEEKAEARKAGPDSVVVEFTEAMKTGDFDKARSLCDTVSMQEYLDAYIRKWEKKSLKDSAAFASTVKILGETVIEINEVEEKDGTCFVRYTLKLDGNTRRCQAGLKKEEGEWKIAEITDGI